MTNKTRFVLVHSPFTGPFTWTLVADALLAAGPEVAIPELRDDGEGPWWERHARSAGRTLAASGARSVVLVGHSGAGPLLPLVAEAAGTRPAVYVFVDAGLPTGGRSRLEQLEEEDPSFATELRADLGAGGRFPDWTDERLADILPDPSVRATLLEEVRPRGLDFFDEPIPTPAGWPDAPCAYLQLSAAYDEAGARARQHGWQFARIDGTHFHMLVDPGAVARAIVDLVREASRTRALDALDAEAVPFEVVRTRPARSAEESAELQGIPIGNLLRTIVVRRGPDDHVFVLVPGGRQIDWPKLRALLGVNRLSLPDETEAREVTGYERGAITPFGATRAWPVIADATVGGLDRVAIGGGARGVNVHLAPDDLLRALGARLAAVTRPAK